jgi:hypothetical protein
MTDIFWASVIMAPAALVVFVPFATYLYLSRTRRTLRMPWVPSLLGQESIEPRIYTSDTAIAIGFVVLSQLVATSLVISGLGSDPFAALALILGVGEWLAALGWVVFLIAASS